MRDRAHFRTAAGIILAFLILGSAGSPAADTFTPYTTETVPETVGELWSGYDPRAEPLESEVVKEWREDGVVCRYVIYTVGTFHGAKARVAAFYTFPEGAEKAPAFVWTHGGGQRAERQRGAYFARNGYVTIDINWGGREIVEGIGKNTDWGKVDPSQGPRFYPGALRPHGKLNLEPDEHTIDPVPSPRNGNWFLLTLAGRRAITFLERQPEVDPEKIGFTGYSMGGVITSMAAIDERLGAVVPMVGGSGFILEDFPGIPGSGRARQYRHPELYSATIDSQSYWPLVTCPVLFLNATNDFHAIFERVYRCMALLPHDNWRVSHKMHYSHNLGPEQWILMNLWFDRYLKGAEVAIAPTPESNLEVDAEQGEATFTVVPAGEIPPRSVGIYYSHDPNPRARFWVSAEPKEEGGRWTAVLPVRKNLPLFAFANCTYRLAEAREAFQGGEAENYTITSREEVHLPDTIELDRLREHAKRERVFEDFSKNGIRDWGIAHGGGLKTYRFQDPALASPPKEAALQWTVDAPRGRLSFRIRIEKNRWLTGATEKDSSYAVARNIAESGEQRLRFLPSDFKDSDGESMEDWENIFGFTLTIYDGERKRTLELSREENLAMLGVLEWVSENE